MYTGKYKLKIHISKTGENKHSLVLFHGWGFDSRIWHSILPLFSEQYSLYCVDLPGFGLTPYMELDEFYKELLQRLPDKFSILGWSLGGLVALKLALNETQRITNLVMVASSPCFIKDNSWPGITKETMMEFSTKLMQQPNEVLYEFMSLQIPGMKEFNIPNLTLEGLKMGLNWLMAWDFRMLLHEFNTPSLFLFGRLDSIVPKATMEAMQITYPNFHYHLVNKAAHSLFISHSQEFYQVVNHFLLQKPNVY